MGLARTVSVVGPGLVFAGAAIGVSHLIQATRAGAGFGLSLLVVVLAVHALKFPAMSFAPRYVAATGESLLTAYRRQGRWALAAFGVVQVGTMFTIVGAVSLVTAQVVAVVVPGITIGTAWVSAGVLVACAGVLSVGGFGSLVWVVRALMIVMAIGTVLATAVAMPKVLSGIGGVSSFVPDWRDAAVLAFVVPLAGWMPAPLDISVWNSLWSREQARASGGRLTPDEAGLDFGVGYALCVLLASCFLVMGAGVLRFAGVEPAAGNAGLVEQTISLYTQTLGSWSRPVIGAAAVAVMFSTTLTVMDALPRTMSAYVLAWRGRESDGRGWAFWVWFVVLAGGGIVVITALSSELRRLVDLATTLSFVSTPVLAYLNHRAMFSVAPEMRPGRWTRGASWVAIVVFALAAVGYGPWWFLVGPGAA